MDIYSIIWLCHHYYMIKRDIAIHLQKIRNKYFLRNFVLGYAFEGDWFVRLLVDWWTLLECCYEEDCGLLSFVMRIEKQNDRYFEDQ